MYFGNFELSLFRYRFKDAILIKQDHV